MRRTYRYFTVLRTNPRCAAFAESAGDGTFVAVRLASKRVAELAGWPGIRLQNTANCKRLLRGRRRFTLLNLRIGPSSSSFNQEEECRGEPRPQDCKNLQRARPAQGELSAYSHGRGEADGGAFFETNGDNFRPLRPNVNRLLPWQVKRLRYGFLRKTAACPPVHEPACGWARPVAQAALQKFAKRWNGARPGLHPQR
jgi:hypothetical protein